MTRHAELVERANEVMEKYLPQNAVERLKADIFWRVQPETMGFMSMLYHIHLDR